MKYTFYPFLLILAISLTSCAGIEEEPATGPSTDGLDLVEKDWHGEWRLISDANWNGLTKIQLEKAPVEFTEHWARDQKNRGGNRPTEESMGRIKTQLSELLDEVFRQELTANGVFTMSDTPGQDVMRITPKIVDLNIYAPDRMRDHIGYSMADSKGNMTLVLEIHNSVSGALLAQMTENREDPSKGYFEWTTSGNNQRAARFMFIRWADKLGEWLMDAKTATRE